MASVKTKTSFLIVPGSFGTASLYGSLVDALKDQGQEARAIDLPSANDGSRLPAPTADGVPGSSALKGLSKADRSAEGKSTAVVGVLYLAAFVLPLGQSNRGWLSSHDAMPEPYKTGIPGGYFPPVAPSFAPHIFNDLESAEEAPRYLSLMTRHSSDSYSGVVSYEAWKDIPSVLVIPGKDVIVPTPLLELMYEQAVAAGGKIRRVFVDGAGHCVNVSRPELVAEELVKLAAES
ncbi:hypothetical protein diail_10866 [Diaporthe ilicicola]|nr:hypothetical protein diail_10866 [Diaporthe ilicicola]